MRALGGGDSGLKREEVLKKRRGLKRCLNKPHQMAQALYTRNVSFIEVKR